MSDDLDVVVIGAGVIGAALAFELSQLGYRTLNIDKASSAGYGSTSSSCAIVRAHYSSIEGVAMAYEGFSYWQDWSRYLATVDELGLARYESCGTLLLKSASGHDEKVLRHYRTLGVDFQEWNVARLKREVPYFDLQEFWPPSRPDNPDFHEPRSREVPGAIYTPGSGYVNDPALATHNLQMAAENRGAQFLFNSTVSHIRQRSGRVRGVTLEGGSEVDARVVVNVAGPHSFIVNRMAGVDGEMNVGTRPLRHEVHHVPAPPNVDYEHQGFHVSDGDSAIYFRPDTGNHILVGSEDPPCDPKVWVTDPDEFVRDVTRDQWEAQVFRLARRIPDLPIPHQMRGVVDLYDCSDDWIPIYDRSGLDGYYMAIGTSGNQFKNAPVVGHCMARLIDSIENGQDHDHDPVKVKARYTGAQLDMGFYSRLRTVNRESSFSVNG